MIGIGIFSWFSYVLPIQERLRLIKDAGFDATSLWWEGEDRHIQPDLARKTGLQIDNIHTPVATCSDLLWLDGASGEDYKDIIISCVEDCRTHEIPTAVIHLTSFEGNTAVTDTGLRRIGEIIDVAEQRNVRLAFENLSNLDHIAAVFGRFPSPYIGFCYDSGHENLNPDQDCLALFGDRLFALHINDNIGDGDIHILPFDGTVDWNAKMQKLKSCKDACYLTLEVGYCWNHEKCAIYRNLSAKEYLRLAYKKATDLLKLP